MMRRRGFNRPMGGGPVVIPPALRRANQLMASGDYGAAAAAFEDLASRAEGRNGPRAPWFYLQAGRARLAMDQADTAMGHFQRGLALFAAARRFGRLYGAGQRVAQELNAKGLTKEAQIISDYVKANVPALPEGGASTPHPKVALPTHCPACGGPVRSDEADWIDDSTAECPFCGSPVRGE